MLSGVITLTRLVRGIQLRPYTRVIRPPQGGIFIIVIDIRYFQDGRIDLFLPGPGCIGQPFGNIRCLLRAIVPEDIINTCCELRIQDMQGTA